MTGSAPRLKLKKREDPRSSGRSGLFADQRGATMVMGVFIAALLVGMIYYVWGIGDAIMHRERMQDASDTAAFSAAVIHARGMNMLALLNLVMAALAFVAATVATAAAMIKWAAVFAAIPCPGCPWGCGFCCDACQHALRHGFEYADASDFSSQTDDWVSGVLDVTHLFAVGIRNGIPLAAQAKVVSYGEVYAPVTKLGVMAPPLRLELPVQDDETNWPCDEKILDPVRIASPIVVWAWAHASPFMAGGIIAGEFEAKSITRRWCDDGYFQRITDDAQDMGNDEYQVQAYMIGDPDFEWTQRGVAVATWGEGESAGANFTRLAELGRVSFAQAEFFYDDRESDWHEWLWHLNWRARLRRWRLSASGAGGITAACSDCGGLGELGASIDSVVVH